MRSLRLKLIVTFLIISVAGTLLTMLIVRFSNERALDALLRARTGRFCKRNPGVL